MRYWKIKDKETHFEQRPDSEQPEMSKRDHAFFGYGVNPRPLTEAERKPQEMKWHCPKCGIDWPTFEQFLYDGCSPVYGSNKRLEGV